MHGPTTSADADAAAPEGESFALVPPVRLPPAAELAAAAKDTPLTRRLRALAAWTGQGRAVSLARRLTDEDARELLDRIGDDARSAAEGIDGVARLWSAALGTCLLELDEETSTVRPGHVATDLGAADDERALESWSEVVSDLLEGQAMGVLLRLFAARAAVARADLADLVEGRSPDALERDLAWLSDAGLIEDRESQVAVTALGTYLGRDIVQEALEQPIPVIGRYGDGSAAGFLHYVRAHDRAELAEELAGWLASRDVESAAAQIAEAVGEVSPAARLRGLNLLIDDLGPAGRRSLDSLCHDTRLAALTQLLLSERGEQYEAAPSQAEVAWTLVDVGAAGIELGGPSLEALEPLGAVNAAPAELIEFLSGLGKADHPWTGLVLSTIADLHPDPRVARTARAELRHHRGGDVRPGERGRKPRKPKKTGKKAGARKKKRR